MKTLLILGGTGLVGQQLVQAALAEPTVGQVVAPGRRPLPSHDRLINPLVDFDHLPATADWWRADAVVCALGTTLRQAGSKAAFRKVDHDYVLAAAELARKSGTPTFVLNSSLGADSSSKSFYLRVKGETEQDLQQLGFDSLTLVRPSLLAGGERPDWRPGETAGLWLARRLGRLIPARYQPVSAAAVGQCMLKAALMAAAGAHEIESADIPRLAS